MSDARYTCDCGTAFNVMEHGTCPDCGADNITVILND
jgi:rRNA maturation endonuclease Nob1